MTKDRVSSFFKRNVVTLFFVALCIFTTLAANQSPQFILQELVNRICRNSVLILALLMPVQCGMGLNFSIVLGAAAGQIGLILITNWGIGGFAGMAVCVLIATAISFLFGWFAGFLFNRTVGQEMITGIIVGFFSKGVFDLLFLVLVGTWLIPLRNSAILLPGGIGLQNTIQFNSNVKYVFDNVLKLKLMDCLLIGLIVSFVVALSFVLFRMLKQKKTFKDSVRESVKAVVTFGIFLVLWGIFYGFLPLYRAAVRTNVPVFTCFIIAVVCFVNAYIGKTKLGQDIRTCGQSMSVASAAGINVGRTRIIATIISTVIASWGQIIFLQNMGLVNTYTSHEQVGTYAVAALLVGGASIRKATVKQVFIGAILFHLLFFTMPLAGNNLFSDSQIGEYFRVFISYGVIAVALALHAWNGASKRKTKLQ
ncbi:MAG: ABC transporter permease [Spirochaetales bacterium]|nr:ABC transporter permease [Spirochaetales bacterium]